VTALSRLCPLPIRSELVPPTVVNLHDRKMQNAQ
jgi:hypothetical protein